MAEVSYTGAGFAPEQIAIQRSLDMRYRFQTQELQVPLRPGVWDITQEYLEGELDAQYDALYEQTYGKGSGLKVAGKDIITFRLRAVGKLAKPRMRRFELGPADAASARKGERPVYWPPAHDFP